jgi:hypothetical protein
MASIHFGADGEVISEDYGTPISDPTVEPRYTDEQLAAALPHTAAIGSRQQAELDTMTARERYLLERANAVSGYDSNKVPQYVEGTVERERLLKAAAGLRSSMQLQLLLSQRSLATDHLDKQAEAAALQAQAAEHAELEARARDILKEDQARELADRFRSRIRQSNGSGMKIG